MIFFSRLDENAAYVDTLAQITRASRFGSREGQDMYQNYQSGAHSIATQENIRAISCHLAKDASTALDIGCNEGLMLCALDNLGVSVTGYEGNRSAADFAEKFIRGNRHDNIKMLNEYLTIDKLNNMDDYDVIVFLSVHHQLTALHGVQYANDFLLKVYDKSNMQLFFQPALIYAKYNGEMPFRENDILGCFSYFTELIRSIDPNVHAEIINITHNYIPPEEQYRPLLLFSKKSYAKGKRIVGIKDYNESLSHPTRLVSVDISEAVSSSCLQSYSPNKWHYMVEACKEIIEGRSNAKSFLKKYYNFFTPKTFGDIYTMAGCPPEIGPLRDWPCDLAGLPHILNKEPPGDSAMERVGEYHLHCCGPMRRRYTNKHLKKLRALISSFKRDGYCPELYPDGYILGSILKSGSDQRFAVCAGQHRVAALSALNCKQFIAKIYKDYLPVLDRETVATWPMVKNGVYSEKEALNIFDAIFNADGLWCKKAIDSHKFFLHEKLGFGVIR